MDTRHTPGPWLVTNYGEGHFSIRRSLDHQRVDETESQYNAYLIAAAPEMLDALSQWRHAEKTGDIEELQNARYARDVAFAKASREV